MIRRKRTFRNGPVGRTSAIIRRASQRSASRCKAAGHASSALMMPPPALRASAANRAAASRTRSSAVGHSWAHLVSEDWHDGHEQTRRVITAPVQDAATTAATHVARGEVAEQRVARLEVASGHQEPEFIACSEESRRTRERNLEGKDLARHHRLDRAEGVLRLRPPQVGARSGCDLRVC